MGNFDSDNGALWSQWNAYLAGDSAYDSSAFDVP